MLTGAPKNKVDQIWKDIWTGGITNPLTVIEQLTYLMFLRSLDEQEIRQEWVANKAHKPLEAPIFPQTPTGQSMRWSRFKDMDPQQAFDIVRNQAFPAIKQMAYGRLPDIAPDGKVLSRPESGKGENSVFARYMSDALFLIPSAQLLQKVIAGLEDLYTHDLKGQDVQGDLYEYMLSKLATAGKAGQFRTPRHIREMMVALLRPTPDDLICDPACGTAGFLISASEYVRKHYGDTMTKAQWKHFAGPMFSGFDFDQTMLRISAMNLMLCNIRNPQIHYQDAVSVDNTLASCYTKILANPPFTGTIDESTIHPNLSAITPTKKTELLFVALFLRLLKTGGECACIVPDGVLFGSSKGHTALRKELVEKHHLRAVISMPSGVFKPYAGVSTAVLVFTKTGQGGTDKVWFYDMHADGFSLDDKRTPIAENDIPDLLQRFHHLKDEASRKRSDQSFLVPKEEIVANNYDLSINKYKQIDYKPIDYPPTSEILARLNTLDAEITSGLKSLEKLL